MEENEFIGIAKDCFYEHLRTRGEPLYFIEFPDGEWLMEDMKHKTKDPLLALPIISKEVGETFIKSFKMTEKLGCKITEHEFVN